MPDFVTYAAAPEIVLAIGAMAVLLFGAFGGTDGEKSDRAGWLSILILAGAGALITMQEPGTVRLFEGAFVVDGFARFVKLLVLAGSAAAILLSVDFFRRAKLAKYEIPVLILLATTGMMMMVSAKKIK